MSLPNPRRLSPNPMSGTEGGGPVVADSADDGAGGARPGASMARAKKSNGSVPASSAGSVRSGRQPDLDLGLNSGPQSDGLSQAAAAASRPAQTVYTQTNWLSKDDGEVLWSSSSSLPSPSEMWHTASSSRNRQSPSRSALLRRPERRKLTAQADLDSKSPIVLLDEAGETSTREPHAAINTSASRGNATLGEVETFRKPVSPPALPKKRHKKAGAAGKAQTDRVDPCVDSSLGAPATQVISLLSSSPESEYVEDYADDSVDETYNEDEGLRAKSVRTQKKRDDSRSKEKRKSSGRGRAGGSASRS